MIKVETERLIIRDNVKSDLFGHHKLMSDNEIMTYINDIMTHSYEESRENLMFSIKESKKDKDRTRYFFAIVDKENNEFIGSIGFTVLIKNDKGGNAELECFILKEHWKKGYTTEAAKAVISYGFDTLGLHKISAGCIIENSKSENVMKKLNMIKEAHLKSHIYHNEEWKDRVEYALFRE